MSDLLSAAAERELRDAVDRLERDAWVGGLEAYCLYTSAENPSFERREAMKQFCNQLLEERDAPADVVATVRVPGPAVGVGGTYDVSEAFDGELESFGLYAVRVVDPPRNRGE